MSIESAIKRPFQNLEVLLIGSVIAAIPIVNFLFVGFLVECIRRSLRKDDSLPAWGGWEGKFLDGLKIFAIQFIYALPAVIALIVLIGGVLFSALIPVLTSAAAGNQAAAVTELGKFFAANIGTVFGGLIIVIILAVLLGLLTTAGILNFAKTGSFGSAFAVSELKSVAFTLRFVWLLIVASLVSLAVGIGLAIPVIILSLIPFIGLIFNFVGSGFLTFAIGIISWTIITEKYVEKFSPIAAVKRKKK